MSSSEYEQSLTVLSRKANGMQDVANVSEYFFCKTSQIACEGDSSCDEQAALNLRHLSPAMDIECQTVPITSALTSSG